MAQQVKFRVGMIGAGQISEFHIYAVRALPQCELVGIVDLDERRAAETADKFNIASFPSLAAMVEAGVDVVHVLTPPHVHAAVALEALELGCHVLIEKPMADDVEECQKVARLAAEKGLTVTVNHSLLYDPQVKKALDSVRAGKLGKIVSVDILRGSMYPPFEGGTLPPHYRTAGYPFRDIGVHCLYLLQEFLGPIESVDADYLSLGGDPNLAYDEWRAMVRCRDGLGQFQLSWNTKPMQSQLIIHGTNGILRIDLFAMFHAGRSNTPLPKAAERVLNAVTDSVQPLVDVPINVWKFVRKEVQAYQGLRDLVADFYARLESGDPPPVSLEDATTVVKWVEQVARAADRDHELRLSKYETTAKADVLVTGASGKLGGAVVRRLLSEGKRVRMMLRRAPAQVPDNTEIVIGDLGDPGAVDRAVAGCELVIHVGAAMSGGWIEHETGTIKGTRHVLDACAKHGVRKLVHISSMSVVDWAGSSGGDSVDEDTAFEPRAEERGSYTRAKMEAEKLVRASSVPSVSLRPGQIFGGGIPLVNGAVARRVAGRWLVLGDGKLALPLVYIDDVVDAVMLALRSSLPDGEVLQIIDEEILTQDEVLELAGGGASVIHVPRPIVFGAGKLSEPVFGLLKRQSPVAVYRLKSALARLRFESTRARQLLDWKPRVGVREGIRREVDARS